VIRDKMNNKRETRVLLKHKHKNNNNSEITDTRVELENQLEMLDELVYFNVSGRIFTTTAFTLNIFPKSLLGSKEKRDQLPRTKYGEIFLNTHPIIFACILTFYQTGIFEIPLGVNQKIFVKDVLYYELEHEAKESGLRGFVKYSRVLPKRKWQSYMWQLLEYPDSSFLARIVSVFSLAIIIISIVIFCWETMPAYRAPFEDLSHDKKITVMAIKDIEIFCITYFSLELIARFFFSPIKCLFIKNLLNVIDLISILPFFLTMLLTTDNHGASVSIYFLRAIRLVRVFRIFKLSRHSNEMKVLGIAVKDSARELGVLLFFILLGVLLFSSAMYYAENAPIGSDLDSIPGAFWWSIVTMTTVGYGDVAPKSTAGRMVGAICAMTGILVIAMPIPIIVNNFTRHYQRLKPVSKYWSEFQEREKSASVAKPVLGLYKLQQLKIVTDQTMMDKYSSSDECESNCTIYA